MSIGSKIKALRRAKDLTQEELAEVLGVSSKAVSQWECGRTVPDISQLPVLCNFFGVTSDELLGIDVFNKTAELDKIADEYMALGKNGRTKEALFLLKESLKRFPNNAWLMGMIIGESTVWMNSPECDKEEKERIEEECRGYSEHILEHSLEDESRYSAINFLCFYYKGKGETEKAWEYARKLPHLFDSREFVTPELCNGSEKVEAERHLKFTLFGRFARSMLANFQLDSGEWLYTEEERMELRDKKFALFSLMFEQGDYGFFNEHLAESHEMQAREYAKRRNKEKCLYHLEQAVESAIGFTLDRECESCYSMNEQIFIHNKRGCTMPKSKERCQEIREEMRNTILQKSLLYFAKNGFAGTKISDLSKSIGIGQGTIYVYFESKEELYQEILRIADYEQELKQLKLLLHLPLSAKSKLRRLSERVLQQLQEDEVFAAKIALNTQMMLEQSREFASVDTSYQSELFACTARIIEQGQKEGTMTEGSTMKLADYYWGVVYLYALKRLFTTQYEMIGVEDLERTVLK